MGNSLKRRKPSVNPRPRILVVCEGEKTEPIYFHDLAQEEEVRLIHVEIIRRGGVPKTLVQCAVDLKHEAEREARRQRDANLDFEEVWCVFDVDEHPKLDEALDQARANAIHVALSNPCFELWLVLHFADQRAYIERQKLQSVCRTHLPGYEKVASYSQLRPRYSEAVRRAHDLAKWQEEQGRKHANPSTRVHELTERLRALGKAALLAEIEKSRR